MGRFARAICASLLAAFAGGSSAGAEGQAGALKNVEEVDGSPSCFGYKLIVSNGSLTDNADGTCTVSIPDNPLQFSPASGNAFEIFNGGGLLTISDTTNALQYLTIDSNTNQQQVILGGPGVDGKLQFYSEQGAVDYYVSLAPAAAMTKNANYTLPASDGTSGQVLSTNGSGVMSWAGHNLLSSTHSDSVTASAVRGDLIVANATPSWARVAVGAANTVLTANGTDPAWSAAPSANSLTLQGVATPFLQFTPSSGDAFELNLNAGLFSLADTTTVKQVFQVKSTQVFFPQQANGYLRIINGGGLITSFATIPTSDLTGTLGVANGGTGATTLTTNGVLYGNGASAVQITAQGGANTVLTANAGAPSFSATPTLTSLTLTGQLNLNPASGTQFEWFAGSSIATFRDATNGVGYLEANGSTNQLTLGDPVNVPSIRLQTDGTGDDEIQLPNASIGAREIAQGDGFVWTGLHNLTTGGLAIPNSGTRPATCIVGQVYMDTSATSGQRVYGCETANNWVLEGDGGGGGGGSPGGSGSELQYRVNGTTFGAVTTSSVSGGNVTLAGSLTLATGTAQLNLNPTSGNQFELQCNSSECWFNDATTATHLFSVDYNDNFTVYKGQVPRVYYWPAAALLPLEFSADAIPPITKNAGTNVDILTRNFDDTALECAAGTFRLPGPETDTTSRVSLDPSGTVSFIVRWFPATATNCGNNCNVIWDVRTVNRPRLVTWDAALTTTAAAATPAQKNAGVTTETNWTATVSALGWNAGDVVEFHICRNGASGSDTFVGDAAMLDFTIEVPQR